MLNKSIFKFIAFTFLLLSSRQLSAQHIDSIHYSWVVYEINEDSEDKKCYILSTPNKSDSSYTGTRKPYLAVTRYAKNHVEEISLYTGYEYKISQDVHLLIGEWPALLAVDGDMAWAKNKKDDKEIIRALLDNKFVKARSDSSYGNYAIDEYSLKGFVRAYSRMKELCD